MERKRKSIRIKNYDYSQPGNYFVTVCTTNRLCLLGEIKNNKMILSELGKIVEKCWLEIPTHYPDVELGSFVVMPNHIHGIITICASVGVQNSEPLQNNINKYQHIIPRSLGSIIRGFKLGVTKIVRQQNLAENLWQRNLYESIIKNEKSLDKINSYITINPVLWEDDNDNIEKFYEEIKNEKE
jgi:putative transposase